MLVSPVAYSSVCVVDPAEVAAAAAASPPAAVAATAPSLSLGGSVSAALGASPAAQVDELHASTEELKCLRQSIFLEFQTMTAF